LNMVGYCILSLLQEPNKPQVHSVITRPFKKMGRRLYMWIMLKQRSQTGWDSDISPIY